MKAVEAYCQEGLELGVDKAELIEPRSVATAEWVRMKCQFGCPGFGMSRCCPPHTPTPEVTRKVIDSYQKAILLHRRLTKGERGKNFNEIIVRLEIKIFLDGYYKAWSMVQVLAVFVRNAIYPPPVNMGMRQGLRWKPAASMFSKRQGTMDFLLPWLKPMEKKKISTD